MRRSTRSLVLALALVTMIGAIFYAGKPRPSSAQNFASYYLRVHCGNRPMPEQFWYDVVGDKNSMGAAPGRCAGNCGGRNVTLTEALAGLPPAVQTGLRTKVENAPAEIVGCITDGAGGKKPPEKNCEKPTPWLDRSSDDRTSECKDRQRWKIEFDKGFAFLTMCGSSVFVHNLGYRDGPSQRTYSYELASYVSDRIGNTVCCDSFKASARTGSSCDPRSDLDCDGISNGTDVTEDRRFPDITTFRVGPGIPINDTPASCFEPPDPNGCDCKWEFMQGERTRGTLSYASQYFYEVTWRCPSTGKTTKRERPLAAADQCGPSAKTMKSFFLVPGRQYTNGFSYSF